jgi:hypothetical protein
MQAGNHLFDISWQEKMNGAECRVTNHNPETWTVKVGCRPYGTGAGGTLTWETIQVQPGQTRSVIIKNNKPADKIFTDPEIIPRAEIEKYADENGIVFTRYGTVDPFPTWYHLWREEHLDIRFYILNGTGTDWKETSVILRYPDGWYAKGRKPGYWENPEGLEKNMISMDLGALPVLKSTVAPFMVKGPQVYDHDYLTKGMSKHFPAEYAPDLVLPCSQVSSVINTSFEAVLRIKTEDGMQMDKKLIIPVRIVPVDE